MVKIVDTDIPPGCLNCNSCGTRNVNDDIKQIYADIVYNGYKLNQPKTMLLCKKCRIRLLKALYKELEE